MGNQLKSIGTGLGALLAISFGYALSRGLPFVFALLFARSGVDFFNTPGEMQEMRAGFEEIVDQWDSWIAAGSDSTAMAFRAWGARVAVGYTTDDELVEIYRWRAALFEDVSSDPTINGICGTNPLVASLDSAHPRLHFGPIVRIQGRGFARQHVGHQQWTSTVDLATDDEAWFEFVDYLDSQGLGHVVDVFADVAEGVPVANYFLCRAQADMYRAAAERPGDQVGSVTFLDFIRAMDLLGTQAGSQAL